MIMSDKIVKIIPTDPFKKIPAQSLQNAVDFIKTNHCQ